MRRRAPVPLPRGFTLVEVMVVVAIIAILSTVAIPTYRNVQLRSKQAERGIMTTSIYRAIEDYYAREGRFPTDWGGGYTFLNLTQWNPDSTPNTSKRPWRRRYAAGDDWGKLSLLVSGDVYYSYYAYGYAMPGGTRYDLTYVLGDLDGDGVQDIVEKEWYFQGVQLVQNAGGPLDCTWEWKWPTTGTVF